MENNKYTDKLFNEKLQNFRKAPPPEVWNEIKLNIGKEKKSGFLPFFWKYAAAVLILIGLGTTLFVRDLSRESISKNLVSHESKEIQNHTRESKATDHEKKEQRQIVSHAELKKSNIENGITGKPNKVNTGRKTEEKEPERFPEREGDKLNNIISELERNARNNISTLPFQIDPYLAPDSSTDTSADYTWDDLREESFAEFTDPEKEPGAKKFTVTAMLSPLYTYRDLSNIAPAVNEAFNRSESGKISYTGGINIGIKTGKKLSIHSGIFISRIGITVNDIFAVAELKDQYSEEIILHPGASIGYIVNNSVGSIEPSVSIRPDYEYSSPNLESPGPDFYSKLNYLDAGGFYNPSNNYEKYNGHIDQFFHYLEIPLMLKYRIIDHALDVQILGGVSTNFLIGNTVSFTVNNETKKIGSTADIQKINYSGNIGIGLDYNINQRFTLLLEPQFKYYLNSINSEELITTRPFSFGLYSGIVYLF